MRLRRIFGIGVSGLLGSSDASAKHPQAPSTYRH